MIPNTEDFNTQRIENIPDRKRRYLIWDKNTYDNNQKFLLSLSKSISPNFEFLLSNSLAAILLVIAFLTDQQPIFILAIIVAPIYFSIIGFIFGISLGILTFLRTAILSWLESFFIVGFSGIFAGYIARQFTGKEFVHWKEFIGLSWANFILLSVGVIFLITIYIRNPKAKSFVVNVAISYCLILPIAASGFALGYGEYALIIPGIRSYFFMFGTAIFLGIATLLISGIRPQTRKIWSPLLALLIIFAAFVYFLFSGFTHIPVDKLTNNGQNIISVMVQPTSTLKITVTKTPIVELPKIELPAINELVSPTLVSKMPPTNTPTITLTPLPTPVWAEIQAGEANGANVRSDPGFSGKIILSVLNGTLVEILPDVAVEDGITWTKIKFPDQTEGWIVRSLLLSATPAPEW